MAKECKCIQDMIAEKLKAENMLPDKKKEKKEDK